MVVIQTCSCSRFSYVNTLRGTHIMQANKKQINNNNKKLLPEPVRVSPIIKLARWSLLVVGIIYGAVHQRRFSRKEAELREIQAGEKVIRDAKLAEEKKRQSERETKAFALLSGKFTEDEDYCD